MGVAGIWRRYWQLFVQQLGYFGKFQLFEQLSRAIQLGQLHEFQQRTAGQCGAAI